MRAGSGWAAPTHTCRLAGIPFTLTCWGPALSPTFALSALAALPDDPLGRRRTKPRRKAAATATAAIGPPAAAACPPPPALGRGRKQPRHDVAHTGGSQPRRRPPRPPRAAPSSAPPATPTPREILILPRRRLAALGGSPGGDAGLDLGYGATLRRCPAATATVTAAVGTPRHGRGHVVRGRSEGQQSVDALAHVVMGMA